MRKVQSFSVDDVHDKEVLDLLNKLSSKSSTISKSAYIVNLIKEDLKKEKQIFTAEQRDEIKNILLDVLKTHPEIAFTNVETEIKENDVDPDVLDALGQFNNIGGLNNE